MGFKHAAREAVVPLKPLGLVGIVRGIVHPVLVQHMDTFDSAFKSHRLLARFHLLQTLLKVCIIKYLYFFQ